MVLLIFLAIFLFFLDKSFKAPSGFFINPAWVVFFLILCSAVWHFLLGTEYAFGIFRSSVSILVSMIFLMLIPWAVSWPVLLRDMQVLFFFCLLLSIILAVFIPSYGVDVEGRGWQGMFNHKNQLGVFSVVVVCVSILAYRQFPLISSVNILLAIFLSSASGSYTSIGVVFLVSLVSMVPKAIRPWVLRYSYLWFTLLVGLIVAVVSISVSGSSGEMDIYGKDMTFTGRDKIWAYALEGMRDSFFGYGFNSIALQNELDPLPFKQATDQLLGSAHNGFISLYYDFGVPGCVLMALFFYMFMMRLKSEAEIGFGVFLFVFAVLISNAFESRLLGFNVFFVLLVFFCSFIGVRPSINESKLN